MKGRVTIRCSSCRRWHPANRKKCEGVHLRDVRVKGEIKYHKGESLGCGKNLGNLPAREYWIEFYIDGKRRRERIGLSTSPGRADLELWKRRIQIDEGEYKPPQKSILFGELAEFCFAEHLSKTKSAKEYRRLLDVCILPGWKETPCHAIGIGEIENITTPIVERGALIMANRVHSLLSVIFNWGVKKRKIVTSPMRGMGKPGGLEKPRGRSLNWEEIRTFWENTAEVDKVGPVGLAALRFALVTGQRRGEIARAEREHVKSGVWTIHDTKNGTTHMVPLSPLASEIIISVERKGKYLFEVDKNEPVSLGLLSRAIKNIPALKAMEGFTFHDLRRTMASRMSEMGIDGTIIDRILNHKQDKLTLTYQTFEHEPEKSKALNAWGAKLQGIIDAPAKMEG